MSTPFLIIIVIIVGMILFSVFDKGENQRIKKAGAILDENYAKNKAQAIVSEVISDPINEDGMDALVAAIQMNYFMNQAKVQVSNNANELIINILEPHLVNQYYNIKEVLENIDIYSSEDIYEAKRFFQRLKEEGIKALQSQTKDERTFFKKAGVKIYTSQIDGNHIYSIDYY